MKNNKGFTLVEMVVTILAASVITAAAMSILFLGMRVHQKTNGPAANQSSISLGISIMEDLAAETVIVEANNIFVRTKSKENLFTYNSTNDTIYLGNLNGTPLLTNVTGFSAEYDSAKRLLTFTLEMDGREYTSTVYSRVDPDATVPKESIPEENADAEESENTLYNNIEAEAAAPAAVFSSGPQTLSEVLNFNALDRQTFLNILTAEEGSTGMASSGEYFSEWYIGGYGNNPEWNPETPWCACFLSWALDQCRSSLKEVPRFAHVDKFLESFDKDHWKTENPHPGDIIFFDWIVDDESIPQHVGAVVSTDGEFVYTIEGNNEGKVASCRYRVEDARILGYGVLSWK